MFRYIKSDSIDARYNLALEQYVFDSLDRAYGYFILWQNANTVVVGRHQNTIAEIDREYCERNDVTVVRRLSGGGAVYHDLGNVNFTFIADSDNKKFDFAMFCAPVKAALASFGVGVEISGRNDMSIDQKKFSGNAQYQKEGRVMHHGTILYDSDLSVVSKALCVPKEKLKSKGVVSVRSRVTNIKPYMREDIAVDRFIDALRDFMFASFEMEPYTLTPDDEAAIQKIKRGRYDAFGWNFGQSPPYSIKKSRHIEGVGRVEIALDVRNGKIEDIAFSGDYFGVDDMAAIAERLRGCELKKETLSVALSDIRIDDYIRNLTNDELAELLLS